MPARPFPGTSPRPGTRRSATTSAPSSGFATSTACCAAGTFRVAGADGPMVAWVRWLGDATALVVLNNGEAPATLTRRGARAPGADAGIVAAPRRRRRRHDPAIVRRVRRLRSPARIGPGLLRLRFSRCRSSRRTGSRTPSSTRSSPIASRGAGGWRRRDRWRTWDAPPTDARLQGRRPVRRRGPARRPRRPRGHRDLPHPDLRVGLEPPVPHVRLPRGRPAPGRRGGPARAARRRAREGHARDPRRGVQPREPRLLGLQPHPRVRPRLAVHRLVPRRPRGARPRAARCVPTPTSRCDMRPTAMAARPLRHRDELLARLRRLVEHAGAAQAQHRQPWRPRVPDERRRALDPVRGRRLAAGRRGRDRRRRVLARVPAPGQGGRTPTPTSSPRSGTRTTAGSRATSSTPT